MSAKIDGREIIRSSLWNEPLHVRVVYVSFLGEMDENGIVAGSRSGLIRACNVTPEQFDEAIQKLEAPDSENKTDHDGRRILKIDGGWLVLNGTAPKKPYSPTTTPTWRTSFEVYQSEAEKEFDRLHDDPAWVSLMRKYHPGVQIRLTLEKMWDLYWGTEAGWLKCKSRRSNTLNWQRAIENNIGGTYNRVFLRRGEPDREQEWLDKIRRDSEQANHNTTA